MESEEDIDTRFLQFLQQSMEKEILPPRPSRKFISNIMPPCSVPNVGSALNGKKCKKSDRATKRSMEETPKVKENAQTASSSTLRQGLILMWGNHNGVKERALEYKVYESLPPISEKDRDVAKTIMKPGKPTASQLSSRSLVIARNVFNANPIHSLFFPRPNYDVYDASSSKYFSNYCFHNGSFLFSCEPFKEQLSA